MKLHPVVAKDAAELVRLRNAAADHLTARYGEGSRSGQVTEKGVLFGMKMGVVRHRRV